MNEQTTTTDRKQNFINFQAKQIEKLIKENSNEDKISKVNTLLTLFLRISL